MSNNYIKPLVKAFYLKNSNFYSDSSLKIKITDMNEYNSYNKILISISGIESLAQVNEFLLNGFDKILLKDCSQKEMLLLKEIINCKEYDLQNKIGLYYTATDTQSEQYLKEANKNNMTIAMTSTIFRANKQQMAKLTDCIIIYHDGYTAYAGKYQCSIPFSRFKLNNDSLIPVVVQDCFTNDVLMVAYMNNESFDITVETGIMTYFSRSRQELWIKGLTSGHFQYVKSIEIDCDNDTLLAKVEQIGAACHTGNRSCFYRNLVKQL